MSGINLDPHDELALPAGESLTGKQFRMVTINTKGEVVLAIAGEVAFVLLNEPEAQGESATIAAPLQVKAVAGEAIKPGWKLKVNSESKLVKATEEKHVVAIALQEAAATGAIIAIYSIPAGCTG